MLTVSSTGHLIKATRRDVKHGLLRIMVDAVICPEYKYDIEGIYKASGSAKVAKMCNYNYPSGNTHWPKKHFSHKQSLEKEQQL